MTGAIENFFRAWGAAEEERKSLIREAVAMEVAYADPRGDVSGVDDLCVYVSQFTAGAPGAAAEVAELSEADGTHTARVRFFGEGWEQFGTYRVTLDESGRILSLNGVAEKGA